MTILLFYLFLLATLCSHTDMVWARKKEEVCIVLKAVPRALQSSEFVSRVVGSWEFVLNEAGIYISHTFFNVCR
jgi:hypothetical protein